LLKTTLADWKALGCTVNIGIELEAYVFQRGHDGKWEPYDTPGAYVYGTGPSVDPEGLMDIVWEAAEKLNFPIEAINSEFDWPQFEFTLEYADALTALDNLFLFRLMAKELLIKQGYLFSFMPKPLSDRGGSGMHLNISLSDEHGNNLLDDPSKDDGLSDMVKPMIAGLITALAATVLLVPIIFVAGGLWGLWCLMAAARIRRKLRHVSRRAR